MELVLLALVAGVVGLLLARGIGQKPEQIAQLRAYAEGQFRRTKVADSTQGVNFDGSIASVLESKEATYLAALVASNYVLTVKAAMPDGSQYIFRSATNGRPWVTRVTKGNSRAVQASVPFR